MSASMSPDVTVETHSPFLLPGRMDKIKSSVCVNKEQRSCILETASQQPKRSR